MSELFQHQKDALMRYADQSIIPLFWEPGTGKSCGSLSIAKAKYEKGEIDVLMIVAPNRIHTQWALEQVPLWLGKTWYVNGKQLNKTPIEMCDVVCEYKKHKNELAYVPHKLNVKCVNIETFSTVSYYGKFVEYCNSHNTMIILDEATVIKNPKSKRTERLLYAFNSIIRRGRAIIGSTPLTKARAILTGTPVTESPFDLWSMFEFLQPNYFHCNYYAFCRKHGLFQTIEVEGRRISILLSEETWAKIHLMTYDQAASTFGVTLQCYDIVQHQKHWEGPYIGMEEIKQAINKTASWVAIKDVHDMPEKMYIRKFLDMGDEQERVYKEMEQKFVAYYKDKTVDAKAKVTVRLRLQQIASGFITSMAQLPDDATDEEVLEWLADPPPREVTWFDTKPKVDQLLQDLEELGSERAVVLTRFTAEAAMLYDELCKKGYKVNMQTGWKKVGTIESFKEGKEQVMVANIRVVSKGFNFQAGCNHLMFYSNTFSLEDRIQSEARVYRLGQTKTCMYYDYLMRKTVDESIKARLEMKQGISDFFWDNHLTGNSLLEGDLELPVF